MLGRLGFRVAAARPDVEWHAEGEVHVGLSETLVYSNGRWDAVADGDAYLSVDIYDSDIATIAYRPASGRGCFYLGYQPRDYFEDPDASERFDLDLEARAFAVWAEQMLGTTVSPDDVRALMADDDQQEADDDLVEETVERLLDLLRLPLPDALSQDSDA